MFIITLSDIIGLTFFAIAVISFIAWFIYQVIKQFIEDQKCRHTWKLERTNSVGAKAWYKCTKCGKENLQ